MRRGGLLHPARFQPEWSVNSTCSSWLGPRIEKMVTILPLSAKPRGELGEEPTRSGSERLPWLTTLQWTCQRWGEPASYVCRLPTGSAFGVQYIILRRSFLYECQQGESEERTYRIYKRCDKTSNARALSFAHSAHFRIVVATQLVMILLVKINQHKQ